MKFTPTDIADVCVIDLEPIVDERGFFARAWCREEFARQSLIAEYAQANVAFSKQRGTLRGLHYVDVSHNEAKLVRCTRGSAFVVAADIRPRSRSYGRWIGIELTADNHRLLYVPPVCAQGYQTLNDDTEVFYQMSAPFVPGSTKGVRYDDPFFNIHWPLTVTSISSVDHSWEPFSASVPVASISSHKETVGVQR